MQHQRVSKEGFVRISFASSDGSEGEAVYETDDPEALFHKLRREAQPAKLCSRNQLTLDLTLAESQSAQHTFR